VSTLAQLSRSPLFRRLTVVFDGSFSSRTCISRVVVQYRSSLLLLFILHRHQRRSERLLSRMIMITVINWMGRRNMTPSVEFVIRRYERRRRFILLFNRRHGRENERFASYRCVSLVLLLI
jgi:hypothetical protein